MHHQKFKGGGSVGILDHIFRDKPGSKSKIDPERTKLNYTLFASGRERTRDDFFTMRDEVGVKRKDQVTLVDSIVTLPKELKDLPLKDQQDFFVVAAEFLVKRYCEKADYCVAAEVHMDETTPHLHLAWLPVLDGKFNAKKILTLKDLKTLHVDLDKHMAEALSFVEPGFIKNGQTIGVRNAEYLRVRSKLEEELYDLDAKVKTSKKEVAELSSEIAELKDDKQKVADEIAELQKDKQKVADEVAELAQQKAELSSAKEELADENAKLSSQKSELSSGIAELEAKKARTEHEIEKRVSSAEEELTGLKKLIKGWKAVLEKIVDLFPDDREAEEVLFELEEVEKEQRGHDSKKKRSGR